MEKGEDTQPDRKTGGSTQEIRPPVAGNDAGEQPQPGEQQAIERHRKSQQNAVKGEGAEESPAVRLRGDFDQRAARVREEAGGRDVQDGLPFPGEPHALRFHAQAEVRIAGRGDRQVIVADQRLPHVGWGRIGIGPGHRADEPLVERFENLGRIERVAVVKRTDASPGGV